MPDESKHDDYRDDAREFARSSDLAQSGTTSRSAGGGPTDSQQQVREKGSQDAWQQPGAAKAEQGGDPQSPSAEQGGDVRGGSGDQGGEIHSRSADPGQSSYGGFTNEGGADPGRDGRVETDDGGRRDDSGKTADPASSDDANAP